MPKIKKNFVSQFDRFLQKWDEIHPEKSDAQKEEIEKHQRIFALRDHAVEAEVEPKTPFD